MYPYSNQLANLKHGKSRSISAENPNGEKSGGAKAVDGMGARYARELGKGWKIAPSVSVEPGETFVIADIDGPGTIQTMWFTGCLGREFIYRIYWDGQEFPSVETPLCDFFCCGWHNRDNQVQMGFAQIDSAMISVNPSFGMNSYWPMPFRKNCRMTLENRGAKASTLFYQINYELAEVSEEAAYFHASFRRTPIVPTKQDYVILDGVRGCGHYVGMALHVGINGPNLWWGEGEIKFYLDGDSEYPTICGTGTEDYFGGAWCWDVNGKYKAYSTLYLGVPFIHDPTGTYDSQQRFAMYRWHVADPIRFERELRITLQDLGWRSGGRYLSRNDDFASVAFWYQTLPSAQFPELPDNNGLEVV